MIQALKSRWKIPYLFLLFSLWITENTVGQFVTNGTAVSIGNDCYRLTEDQTSQAGSILSAGPIDLAAPFATSGQFNFGDDDGGADGITFIFTTTNTALGGGGGGIAYQGIVPSFVVEFDTWENGNNTDPGADHIGVQQNGDPNHGGPNALVPPITVPNLEDGQDHCFTFSWDPNSQTFNATLDGSAISYIGDIAGIIGSSSVFWGFTGSTGGATNEQTVCFGAPMPMIDPMDDIEICPGESVTLIPDPGGQTYNWTPDPTLSPWNVANPTATPSVTTTYFVEIGFNCGGVATDDVMVTVLPSPIIIASNNGPLCVGDDLELMASGGISYSWTGPPAFSSSSQNPIIQSIDFINAGTYEVMVNDANGCTGTATTDVVIFPPPVVAIVPLFTPICEDADPVQLEALPPGGVWAGVADANGLVDPSGLAPGSYSVTYTYVDQNGCVGQDETFVQIVGLPIVEILPAGPFCDTDPVQTLQADPSGGTWGGAANFIGEIDPQALGAGSFVVSYEYTDGNLCTVEVFETIEILTGTSVEIQAAGPFCESENTQTLQATPLGGTWGGAANASGQIEPMILGPGSHLVTYAVAPQGSCPGADSLLIEINADPTANIQGMGTICAGSGDNVLLTILATGAEPIEITYAIDNVPQTPITVSNGTTTLPTNQAGIYTIVGVIDGNGCSGLGSGSAMVEVVEAPQVINFETTCDPTQTTYVVSFEVTGGDPSTYNVSGPIPGSFTVSPPYIFTSQAIASGDPYSFEISDGNMCDLILLSGSFSCQCITDAGTMDLDPITKCEDSGITATHNNDQTLDANDILIFVIHDGNGNSLGTVFESNGSPVFNLNPPMMPGITYYISAVAGDDDGAGGVDLNDPCLSVSFGTPVQWQAFPSGSLSSDVEICEGEEAVLTFSLSGNAPFDVTYEENGQNIDLINIFDGHTITVSPNMTSVYNLIFISDNSFPACFHEPSSSVTVTVNLPETTPQSLEICQGESILLGGEMQMLSGTYFDTLSTFQGCDSVIISLLTVNQIDTVYENDSDCNPGNVGTFTNIFTDLNGCDSVVILTVVFSETDTVSVNSPTCDPTQVGVFTNNYITANGCDSVVIETFFLLPSDSVYLTDSSCNPNQVGIFTNTYLNQWGCDSVVVLDVAFSSIDTFPISNTTCDPALAGIFSNTYTTPDGCDSVVIEAVSLLPSDTVDVSDTSCDPANVGIFTNIFNNQFGCDSTVVLTVTFSEVDSNAFSSPTCDPGMAGVFSNIYTSSDGCDSVVIETVFLQPSDTVFINDNTCDPNLAGIYIDVFTNQFGCDSMVISTFTLSPSDLLMIDLTSCEPNDTGTVVTVLANQFGCDSTIITSTTLLPPNQCGIEITLEGSTIPCGENTGFITLTVLQGQGPFLYEWDGPSSGNGNLTNVGDSVDIPLTAGTYTLIVMDANGMSTMGTVTVEALVPPDVSVEITSVFAGFDISCDGAADGTALAMGSGGQTPYTYLWSNGDVAPETANLSAGTYSVTITDALDCTNEAEINLQEPPALDLTFIVSDIDCFGQEEGFVTVTASGGSEPYEFAINDSPFQSDNTFFSLTAGNYTLTVQDANGCQSSDIILINAPVPVDVNLGDDDEISLGDGAVLHALVNVPFELLENISWTGLDSTECPQCLDQPVAPLITTSYSISVLAENGCSDSDQLTLFVDRSKNVYVPNAFSPNGDGTNEVFMIFAPNNNTVVNISSFLVFSRWGESVFEYYDFLPNNPAYGWDGSHKGQQMNPAVFVWFAEIEFIDGTVEIYEGDVVLMR